MSWKVQKWVITFISARVMFTWVIRDQSKLQRTPTPTTLPKNTQASMHKHNRKRNKRIQIKSTSKWTEVKNRLAYSSEQGRKIELSVLESKLQRLPFQPPFQKRQRARTSTQGKGKREERPNLEIIITVVSFLLNKKEAPHQFEPFKNNTSKSIWYFLFQISNQN